MTYCDYLDLTKEIKCFPVAGTNEYGENVIIEHYDGANGDESYFKVTTFQSNDWVRINYFYKGGNVDKIYER